MSWYSVKHDLWPAAKVRLRIWWWVVKYRGKKNIPSEVVLRSMSEGAERLNRSLRDAFSAMPADMPEADRRELLDLMKKAGEFDEQLKNLRPQAAEAFRDGSGGAGAARGSARGRRGSRKRVFERV